MNSLVKGLHHVTAMADDPQKNVDFYAGVLGIRLVKKTINFDAPEVYHLYYGDEAGHPGTIMTFFPYKGLVQGRKGKGQLTATAFSIPINSISYWMDRLHKFDVTCKEPQHRFDEVFISLEDHDGLGIELVATSLDARPGFTYGHIPLDHAIKGFYGVTLSEDGYERTAGLLTTHMDHTLYAESGNRFRYSASGKIGDLVDIVCEPGSLNGYGGSGTVHHVAFATADDTTINAIQSSLTTKGIHVTPVLDRQYFHSIYFREPGGVLFEVATSDIGFTLDEPIDRLGEAIKIPPWEEPHRAQIERGLIPIAVDWKKYL